MAASRDTDLATADAASPASGLPAKQAGAAPRASGQGAERDAGRGALKPVQGPAIRVRGARQHNLKNIDLDIPKDTLTVITGLSGSGKSSLAFDTIYAEGQRRYVESLSAYARQFLQLMGKPDVDSIEGLSPAISIEQKTTSHNPRSTVGTVTEIHDYMRLLWARVGVPYSPATGLPIEAQTVSMMVDRVLGMGEGKRLLILAPIARGKKGEWKKELAELQRRGFERAKINGTLYRLEEAPNLDKKRKHDIEAVVDRIVVRPGMETRLADSFETALGLADGVAYAEDADSGERTVFSSRFACPESGFTIEEIEPRLFSFNSPQGACPVCDGLGTESYFDPALVVPDDLRPLAEGAVAPWAGGSSSAYYDQTLESLAKHFRVSMKTPWTELPAAVRKGILHGTGTEVVTLRYKDGLRAYEVKKPFEGVLPNLERRLRETDNPWVREDLERYKADRPCKACQGARLKPEALAVKVAGLHIAQASELSIRKAMEWFQGVHGTLTVQRQEIAGRILREINERLRFLVDVGLDYLSLSRSSATLSGGESQRIRLASQIGSGLTGVLYVLDEPSIGLHQRDNERLLTTLRRLRDLGNTVLVVEHDEDAIRAADHLIDIGPAAGKGGGNVIAQGTPEEVAANPNSVTGAYLSGRQRIEVPAERRKPDPEKTLRVVGARGNNLKDVTAEIPLGTFTCVTGVSGGGKSTLVIETLYKAVARRLMGSGTVPAPHDRIEGLEYLDKIIDIDQSPIGRTPRSNPATYTGLFAPIRDWFSELPESRARGYKPGRFSFNVKGGRCEACQGDGVLKIEMHFLPDVYVTCDTCKGKRYNRETLEVRFRDKSIADVLEMTVDEGCEFFSAVPSIRDKLLVLREVGLGYIHLGQQATTLSGGEAQRIKLAKELSRRATGRTLYILDEPTTGLHFEDVRKLLELLQALVKQGNTVLVIEHNLEVIKTADWLLDLGPEGGEGGGRIVAQGTPEEVAANPGSHTGHFLAPLLPTPKAKRKRA
ncbi:Excinuclease ABC subunit A [Roseomonas mucosa]|uniref:UvrABC system protein A n=1 Tax=Roseomonas mucosa TaxID=207340 RepID=A0A379N489_9PROT|nr:MULTISPECIES: excinuclease ABC subunit UvrA [Roseomonas]MBS5901215.1 excinuclease ABC subunit UvrA [Acetobacteraceae bacterium]MCG7352441.1 excinuclease ABC subunit UvrA [Roseomonas mucosa]MCG7355534.1 excinuclease ABC subunit UvrA [Roseomonas mucosa]MDT8288248.1 excinuclease ABC subunit UvrA [Roseomonas mucosa]MDT8293937.1 excinuclease ABC subunit UvrA [Roseomonas mucosa]